MMKMRIPYSILLGAALMLGTVASANVDPGMDAQVSRIDGEWARIKYQVRDSARQYDQLKALAGQAGAAAARYPGRAEPLLWQGIETSEEAAQASMIQKLGLARAARDILERARAINPRAANGGVLMSLGVLYYRVPGFPIGFGDTKKARSYLEAALQMDPNGLDSNFFYADFLNQEGDKAGARAHLLRALKAPANPARPVWDAGRRGEARALLAKIQRGG
jgi:tetratricopeptide (TPR) repeat protein